MFIFKSRCSASEQELAKKLQGKLIEKRVQIQSFPIILEGQVVPFKTKKT